MANMHSSYFMNKVLLEKGGLYELDIDATQIAAGLHGGTYAPLTVSDLQTNPATGTVGNPEQINNNVTVNGVSFDVIGEYAEIDFGAVFGVKQWRMYCPLNAAGTVCRIKIVHWDGEQWVDNKTDIAFGTGNTWTDWADLPDRVLTEKIRMIATALSGANPHFVVMELEMKW